MPSLNIWRRWTGWGRRRTTAVFSRPSSRRAKSTSHGRSSARPTFLRSIPHSRSKFPLPIKSSCLKRAGALSNRRGSMRRGFPRPRATGRFMRFTSLVIELIRARPRLIVWIVVLFQAALWLIVPLLFYASPPGNLATVLAFGREYQVGTDLGPPLSFWLADIAFRVAGNHMFGVYVLAQLCSVATLWVLYQFARAIVGKQQAVLVVLLTMTITAFASPNLEFGPLVAARPLWALLLFHSWQL